MIIKKEINIPIYGGYLIIMITDKKTNISDHYDDLGEENEIDYGHCAKVNSIQNKKSTRSYLVAFNIKNEYAKITNGVISHEAFHATDMILNYSGLELVDQSCEAYSYLLQWIINNIYQFFNEKEIEISLNAVVTDIDNSNLTITELVEKLGKKGAAKYLNDNS